MLGPSMDNKSPPGSDEEVGFLTNMSVKLLSAGGDVSMGVVCN